VPPAARPGVIVRSRVIRIILLPGGGPGGPFGYSLPAIAVTAGALHTLVGALFVILQMAAVM
jgi:hypothetical protein